MEKSEPSGSIPYSKSHRTFESNIYMLAYFLGTTEDWYEKQVKIKEKQVRTTRKELRQTEIRVDKLFDKYEKSRLSKDEEKLIGELSEKLDDLTDIDIFVPMETKAFRQFTELIRILGLTYLVSIFEGYLIDIVREILLA